MAKTAKSPAPRLKTLAETELSTKQAELLADIRSTRGPRTVGGPFGVLLHAPDYGHLAQKLGAHVRYRTAVPPRLSEFAILVIARIWRAQYEWYAHSRIAANAGVSAQTIKDLQTGRVPKRAPKDERAIYDFIVELHKTRRVTDRTYARVHAILGDAGMVELTGILGYYTLIAMTLDVFRVPLPDGEELPFPEKKPSR
jgi:4-carboxymuconolactone decarboxylase